MTTTMRTMKRWQDEYIDLMARAERPVVTFVERAAESSARYVPERPEWAFLAEVPALTELVDNQLKFRRRVVDHQAAFVRTLMVAMRPVLVRLDPKQPAAKPSVAKVPAVKPRTAKARAAKSPAVKAVRMHAA